MNQNMLFSNKKCKKFLTAPPQSDPASPAFALPVPYLILPVLLSVCIIFCYFSVKVSCSRLTNGCM